MNYADWYTDTVDIYRVSAVMSGNLTRAERQQVLTAVPCRIYRSDSKAIKMTSTASNIDQENRLACDNSVDIHAGDELIIHRGAGVGKSAPDIRAFAGNPDYFFEPFGAVIPGLAHQEIRLLQQEVVK